MATQSATTGGGYIINSLDSLFFTWEDTRNSLWGTNVSVNPATSRIGAYSIFGRGNSFNIIRTYLVFDLSSVVGTISSMNLVLTANSSVVSSFNVIVLKSAKPGVSDDLTTNDFGEVDFETLYSIEQAWAENDINTIELNSTAISDANTNNELILCVTDYVYDYSNSTAPSTVPAYNTIQYSTGTPPYLDYTAITSYGNIIMGIIPANIAKFNNKDLIDISNVMGV
jgi:hypothetical protein